MQARGECVKMVECATERQSSPPVPPELEPAVRAIALLSPSSRGILFSLLDQLAEREGITVLTQTSYALPVDNLKLWESKLRQEGYSLNTIRTYLSTLRQFLRECPSPSKLDMQMWMASQMETRSSSAVSTHRKALRSLFGFLFEEGLWPTDPTAKLGGVKVSYKAKDPPSMDEVTQLLTYTCRTAEHTKKYRLFILLLATTALRVTEAASLRKDRVFLDRHELRVVGKGDKERVVPLVPIAEAELELYMRDNPNDSIYVFPGDTHTGWWSTASFEKTMGKACEKLGLKRFTPHSLRHFYATYALKGGAKLEVVSDILGHASTAITADLYRHVLTQELHDTSRQFAPLASGVVPRLTDGTRIIDVEPEVR